MQIRSPPHPAYGRQAPAAIGLLLTKNIVDDGLLLCPRKKSQPLSGRPSRDYLMDEQLTGVLATDIVAEELEVILNRRAGAIVLRSRAHSDGRERRSIV